MTMYFFIVNLTSRTGKTKKIWLEIQRELKKRNVLYKTYLTKYESHAKVLASEICTECTQYTKENPGSETCLVVVGGDGTVNEVINGMHHFEQVTFGYIATGSGNDLGRGLGISKNHLEALEHILNAEELYAMDLGHVTWSEEGSSYFAISSGIGLDADVCKMALTSKLKVWLNRFHMGSLTYMLLTMKALVTMPTTKVTAVFDQEEKRTLEKVIFIAGMNHRYEGGGIPMAPLADDRDQKLSVCCAYGIPRWRAFLLLPVLAMGKHTKVKGFEVFNCTSYELWLERSMVLHSDGEYRGTLANMKFTCIPGKLKIRK